METLNTKKVSSVFLIKNSFLNYFFLKESFFVKLI